MRVSKYSFLDIWVNDVTITKLHALIEEHIHIGQQRIIIANHNLHSLYLHSRESKMRQFYQLAHYIHVDGMSLIYISRMLGVPLKQEHRVTYVDWIDPLAQQAAESGWRLFFLGSKPGVATQAAQILRGRYPKLEIDTSHGYFSTTTDCAENTAILNQINKYQPNILLVGMGMPRQEYWVLDNINNINANIILLAGACMDYVAGRIPTPPRWMGKIGVEWLFRLICEPRRLARRYLIEPWSIARLIIRELFKL